MTTDGEPPRPTEALPCAGVRVLDVTGAYGAYAGRLLADLGADVLRVLPPEGDPLAGHRPLAERPGAEPVSAFAWFANLNKTAVIADLAGPDGPDRLRRLAAGVDVLLETWTAAEAGALQADTLAALYPGLIRVSITPFGHDGPWSDRPATDLVTLASGGLLSLGGYPDAEPIAAYGDQSLIAASIFGAVAALVGLVARNRDGRGRTLDVSAQEAVAAALEDAIPQFDLTGRVRRRTGGDPREAGTGILRCRDGHVSMVAGRLGTARAWKALTAWLVEERVEGADELASPAWESFPFRQRPEAIARFTEVFDRFASRQTMLDLYREAQRRSIALAPVNALGDVLTDPQLEARGFFRDVQDEALGTIKVPGRPYRLAGSSGPVPRPMRLAEVPEAVTPGRRDEGAA